MRLERGHLLPSLEHTDRDSHTRGMCVCVIESVSVSVCVCVCVCVRVCVHQHSRLECHFPSMSDILPIVHLKNEPTALGRKRGMGERRRGGARDERRWNLDGQPERSGGVMPRLNIEKEKCFYILYAHTHAHAVYT